MVINNCLKDWSVRMQKNLVAKQLQKSPSYYVCRAFVPVNFFPKRKKNKLGLSCAKLSLPLASYLLSWTSCEYDKDMLWKRMNKSWASQEQVLNKSWRTHQEVGNKSWTSPEQVITSHKQVINKSKTSHEQVDEQYMNKFWTSCIQVVNK